ncbi:MAG: hypothetical protein Q9223_004057, partial [Gallowayella weberi]
MGQKRKNHPSAPSTSPPKRHRRDDEGDDDDYANAADQPHQSSKAQVDPTYGQRSAFPGLDSPVAGEADLFYGPAEDGLEYLRMVRSEAKGVPNLLTAATVIERDLYEDYPQGYYEDGAYTALPPPPPTAPRKGESEVDEDIDPQEAYYVSLHDRFQALRALLHSHPPVPAANASASDVASRLNEGASSRLWRATLLYIQPTTTLVSQLNQDAVMAGIAALENYMSLKSLEKQTFLGAWAWGLLARCREVGMMGSEEVGVVRDLAKKARGMVRALAAGLGGGQRLEDEEHGDEEAAEEQSTTSNEDFTMKDMPTEVSPHEIINDSATPSSSPKAPAIETHPSTIDPDEITTAKTRLLASLPQPTPNPSPQVANDNTTIPPITTTTSSSPPPPPQSAHPTTQENSSAGENNGSKTAARIHVAATLDMIITVVGEAFGQRDLLAGRMV